VASYLNFEQGPTTYNITIRITDLGPAGPSSLVGISRVRDMMRAVVLCTCATAELLPSGCDWFPVSAYMQYTDTSVSVTVLNVDEAPLFGVNTSGVAYVPENNGSVGSTIFVVPVPDDPDDPLGLSLIFTIVNGTGLSNFHLVGRNVVVSPGAYLDFEDPSANLFVLVINVRDPVVDGVRALAVAACAWRRDVIRDRACVCARCWWLSSVPLSWVVRLQDNFTLGILVTDLNEAPYFNLTGLSSPVVVQVMENAPLGTVVFTPAVVDVDALETLRFVSGGARHRHNGTVFAINATTGVMTVAGLVNFEDGACRCRFASCYCCVCVCARARACSYRAAQSQSQPLAAPNRPVVLLHVHCRSRSSGAVGRPQRQHRRVRLQRQADAGTNERAACGRELPAPAVQVPQHQHHGVCNGTCLST
jgi:hypothetical protein